MDARGLEAIREAPVSVQNFPLNQNQETLEAIREAQELEAIRKAPDSVHLNEAYLMQQYKQHQKECSRLQAERVMSGDAMRQERAARCRAQQQQYPTGRIGWSMPRVRLTEPPLCG